MLRCNNACVVGTYEMYGMWICAVCGVKYVEVD